MTVNEELFAYIEAKASENRSRPSSHKFPDDYLFQLSMKLYCEGKMSRGEFYEIARAIKLPHLETQQCFEQAHGCKVEQYYRNHKRSSGDTHPIV